MKLPRPKASNLDPVLWSRSGQGDMLLQPQPQGAGPAQVHILVSNAATGSPRG